MHKWVKIWSKKSQKSFRSFFFHSGCRNGLRKIALSGTLSVHDRYPVGRQVSLSRPCRAPVERCRAPVEHLSSTCRETCRATGYPVEALSSRCPVEPCATGALSSPVYETCRATGTQSSPVEALSRDLSRDLSSDRLACLGLSTLDRVPVYKNPKTGGVGKVARAAPKKKRHFFSGFSASGDRKNVSTLGIQPGGPEWTGGSKYRRLVFFGRSHHICR